MNLFSSTRRLFFEFLRFVFFGGLTVLIYMVILYSLAEVVGLIWWKAALVGLVVQWTNQLSAARSLYVPGE